MRKLLLWFCFLFLLVISGIFLPGYYKFLYYEIAAWSLLALSTDILYGQAGMLSFGQSVFLAFSGYVFFHLSSVPEIGLLGAALAAIIASVLVAAVLGRFMVRLEGHYFVIATVILSLGSFLIASSLIKWTGGDDGLPVSSFAAALPGPVPLPSLPMNRTDAFYVAVAIGTVAMFSLAWRLRSSVLGLLVTGVKHGPFRMKALGYQVLALRYGVWCLAAATAAVGGVSLILVNRYASATQFHWSVSGEGVVWAILGGVDTVWGAWVGAAALITLKDLLSTQFEFYPILVGLLLVGLVHLRSEGLLRALTRFAGGDTVWRRARSRREVSKHSRSLNIEGADIPGDLLDLQEVSKVFLGTVALDRCNLKVEKTSFSIVLHDGSAYRMERTDDGYPAIAIVGPNGAGKTTLLNVVCGYLPPDTGTISSKGFELEAGRAIPGIGRSFQEPQLWDQLSVYENLLLGGLRYRSWREFGRPIIRDEAGAEAAMFMASWLGLLDELDKNASELSFGKRKRLDVGVALASQPQLVVLDEPTAGVSPRELLDVEELIREMIQWTPVILVEHNLDTIRRLGLRVLFMAEGRFLECGSLDEVLTRESVREQFAGLRVRGE